jgi:hypothetical protein
MLLLARVIALMRAATSANVMSLMAVECSGWK